MRMRRSASRLVDAVVQKLLRDDSVKIFDVFYQVSNSPAIKLLLSRGELSERDLDPIVARVIRAKLVRWGVAPPRLTSSMVLSSVRANRLLLKNFYTIADAEVLEIRWFGPAVDAYVVGDIIRRPFMFDGNPAVMVVDALYDYVRGRILDSVVSLNALMSMVDVPSELLKLSVAVLRKFVPGIRLSDAGVYVVSDVFSRFYSGGMSRLYEVVRGLRYVRA